MRQIEGDGGFAVAVIRAGDGERAEIRFVHDLQDLRAQDAENIRFGAA